MFNRVVSRNATIWQRQIAKTSVLQICNLQTSRVILNGSPQSPWKVFYDTFRLEVKKSSELKENIKALQDERGRVADSEAFKKAKEAFDRAQKGSSAAGKVAKNTADAVGGAAYKAWESDVGKGVRHTVKTGADAADKVFDPVRKTTIYKNMSDVIDDGSSTAYGGFLTKEQRQRLREKQLAERIKKGGARPVKENENAGGALISTDQKPRGASLSERWEDFKVRSPIGRGLVLLKEKWDDSENAMIALVRTVIEKVTGFFAETEQAKVVKNLRQIDPSFKITEFTQTLTNYIVPELLDAYIKNDSSVLRHWFSEAPYNVWEAGNKQFVQQGIFSDGKILDIRGVDIVTCRILQPNDVPVLVVSCRAQEINLYRYAKTGKIAAGTEDHILLSTYAMVFTRVPEEIDDPVTEGWKVIEFVRGASRTFH